MTQNSLVSETTARGLSLAWQVSSAHPSLAEGQDRFSQELKEQVTLNGS